MPTETQPAPNLSTEHQRDGDARHPSDTLDRGQQGDGNRTQPAPNASTEPREQDVDDRTDTPGGNDQESVPDRSNVGTTSPDAYPKDQQGGATPA